MPHKAVFLDRDGVLNANFVRDGKAYAPRSFAEFRLLPGIKDAVGRIKAAGFLAIVITNQPDIALGLTPRSEVDAMHAFLRRTLPLDDIKVCFHTDADRCACRKPKPGLLLEAAAQYEIDLKSSYFVGDRWRDVLAGEAAGCATILVDHGLIQEHPIRPDKTVASLDEAVAHILAAQ